MSGDTPTQPRSEPWESIFHAVSNYCQHTGPVVLPIGCLDCAQIADDVVGALGPPTTEQGHSPYPGRFDVLDPYPRTAQNSPTHTRIVYRMPWIAIPRNNSLPAAAECHPVGPERKLPQVWAAADGKYILDPDGWRTTDAPPFDAPCTRTEYDARIGICTVGPLSLSRPVGAGGEPE